MTAETTATIVWRRLDRPGHESARLVSRPDENLLHGTAVFLHEGRQPCRLDYRIACAGDWQTVSVLVNGWVGDQALDLNISVDRQKRWTMNGAHAPDLDGCVDIDLNFSPSTNLLPIRRLNHQFGTRAEVRTAWLRFPSFSLEPLDQVYQRGGADLFRYESGGGKFVAWLKVNEVGFVTDYPGFWRSET